MALDWLDWTLCLCIWPFSLACCPLHRWTRRPNRGNGVRQRRLHPAQLHSHFTLARPFTSALMGDPLGFDDMPDQTPEPLAGPQLICRDNRPYVSRTLRRRKKKGKKEKRTRHVQRKISQTWTRGSCLGLVGWESTPPSLSPRKMEVRVDVSKKKKIWKKNNIH
ncbi:hypothetical protein V8C43DRAFT_281167 [Trichoderma afarasin]